MNGCSLLRRQVRGHAQHGAREVYTHNRESVKEQTFSPSQARKPFYYIPSPPSSPKDPQSVDKHTPFQAVVYLDSFLEGF